MTEQPPPQRRNGRGEFIPTMDTMERRARAAELFAAGKPYREIAAIMGVDLHQAWDYVQQAMAQVVQPAAEEAVLRSLRNLTEERARLTDLRTQVEALMAGQHITVSQGRVVYQDDGSPVPDDEFTLKCVDRLAKIDEQLRRNDESTRRLLGLDQPAKTQMSGGVTYEVVGIDPEALR